MIKVLLINFMLVTMVFISLQANADENSPQFKIIWESEDTIFFMGQTSFENFEALQRLNNERPGALKKLIVSSGGGNTIAGLEFGKFIRDNHLTVEVRDACVSSCANYIFPAAKKKILEKNAIVGWHGGALQIKWEGETDLFPTPDLLEKFYQDTYEWCTAEAAFYKSIGAKQEITILRQQPSFLTKRTLPAWTYTLEQLKALGVDNVYTEDGVMPDHNPRIGFTVEVVDFSPEQLNYQLSCEQADALRRAQN